MKENYTIFVEGVADERLVSQLIEVTFGTQIEKGKIIVTNGWKALLSPATEKRISIRCYTPQTMMERTW